MSEVESWLLLALSVLVARQRALSLGEPDPVAVAALLEPEIYRFAYQRGAHRCRIARDRLARFQAALLVLERQDFVSPVSALAPQLRLLDHADGGYEAKLLPHFVEALALAEDDPVRACYSPLQLLFDQATGFYDPLREPWHAYAGRALAARLPRAEASAEATRSRVRWPDGSLELGDGASGVQLSAQTSGLAFELGITARSFELRVQAADATRGLFADLLRLRTAAELPVGIDVADMHRDGMRGLSIRGSL